MCTDLEQKPVRKGCISVNTLVLPSIQLECVSLYTARPRPHHRCWEQCAGNMDGATDRKERSVGVNNWKAQLEGFGKPPKLRGLSKTFQSRLSYIAEWLSQFKCQRGRSSRQWRTVYHRAQKSTLSSSRESTAVCWRATNVIITITTVIKWWITSAMMPSIIDRLTVTEFDIFIYATIVVF